MTYYERLRQAGVSPGFAPFTVFHFGGLHSPLKACLSDVTHYLFHSLSHSPSHSTLLDADARGWN